MAFLLNGRGNYVPNWPVELFEYPNLYEYAANDPINGIDSFGLTWWNPLTWEWLEALWEGIKAALGCGAGEFSGAVECGVGMTQAYTNAPCTNRFLNDPDNAPVPPQAGY